MNAAPDRVDGTRWLVRAGVLLLAAALGAALGYAFHRPLAAWTGAPAWGAADGVAPAPARRIKYWRAPMDPSYVSDRPGKSPMGMDLVPVYEDEVAPAAGELRIDPTVVQTMGVRTGEVTIGPLVRTLRTLARLDYDERTQGAVALKFGAWVEERVVDTLGAPVRRGDPLLRVYAPDLISAQEEYLIALRAARAQASDRPERNRALYDLLLSSRRKLGYWDIPEEEVKQLELRDAVQRTILIRSPLTGVVTHLHALPGEHVAAGTPLYRIADLSTIWAYVSVYEQELAWVQAGQEVVLSLPYLPGRTWRGRVAYVYPYVSPRSRDVKVRLEFANHDLALKPDMYGDAVIRARLAERALLIPDEAILDTGTRQLVFLALGEGRFQAREVVTGVLAEGGQRQVLGGLEPGERVVLSGQFLLDSESRLREAVRKLTGGPATPAPVATATPAPVVSSAPAPAAPPVPAPATASLPLAPARALLDAYLQVQGALLADRLPEAAALDGLRASVSAVDSALVAEAAPAGDARRDGLTRLAGALPPLERAGDLAAARAAWKEVSVELAALLRQHRPAALRPVWRYWCPMTAGGWLQDHEGAENPYGGPSMAGCGQLEERLP